MSGLARHNTDPMRRHVLEWHPTRRRDKRGLTVRLQARRTAQTRNTDSAVNVRLRPRRPRRSNLAILSDSPRQIKSARAVNFCWVEPSILLGRAVNPAGSPEASSLGCAHDRPRPSRPAPPRRGETFVRTHPRSAALAARGRRTAARRGADALDDAVAGAFPLFVDDAPRSPVHRRRRSGVRRPLPRRHRGDDRSRAAVGRSGRRGAGRRGFTTMLPSSDAAWVGTELGRRFGLPRWQLAMSATDANRFVLRFARFVTGRPKVAVMDWCYHGTVDETLAVLDGGQGRSASGRDGPAGRRRADHARGAVQRRRGAGPARWPTATWRRC